MNLDPGTVTSHSAILVALRTNEILFRALFNPTSHLNETLGLSFDVISFLKDVAFEHMNKRKCEHLWGQPHSLAALLLLFFLSS